MAVSEFLAKSVLVGRARCRIAAFRKEEAEILTTYGVVDREKGIFRIPIEEAMKLTLERGLPVQADPAASPTPAAVVVTTPAKAPAKVSEKASRP